MLHNYFRRASIAFAFNEDNSTKILGFEFASFNPHFPVRI